MLSLVLRHIDDDDGHRPQEEEEVTMTVVAQEEQGGGEEEEPKVCLTEEDVGITAYVNDAPGFKGALKQRYSDFIVNEVGR